MTRTITETAKADRPVLDEVLSYLRNGDMLVAWRLDRLGRSLQHLSEVVAQLTERWSRGRLDSAAHD